MWDLNSSFPAHVKDEYLCSLRKAMLLSQREKTRERGQRMLLRLAALGDPYISPAAMCGLGSSYLWSNEFKVSLDWLHKVVILYSMTRESAWALSLMASIYRMLGMRTERFEAERRRFLMMRKIAFQGERREDRIYALGELVKELESRDLKADAQQCREELRELMLADSEINSSPSEGL